MWKFNIKKFFEKYLKGDRKKMSLKDNFNQAVKDLLKKDGLVSGESVRAEQQQDSGAKVLEAQRRTATQTSSEPASEVKKAAVGEERKTAPLSDMNEPENEPYYDTEETTIISRNTFIDGNVRSFANITVDGSIKGDVQISKNANLSGKVIGNLQCSNATMQGSSMQGNITSKGQIKMDRDSLILGDIDAQYLDLNGKIKGNIQVGGKAEFKQDAIIFGNINASTISVVDGATIQGYVNTTFLQESASTIFPEGIAVSE